MKKYTKELIIGGAIILAVLIYVGGGIYKYNKDNQIKSVLLQNRLNCILVASDRYQRRWNSSCKNLGFEDECNLPTYMAEAYGADLAKEKDDCIQLFK